VRGRTYEKKRGEKGNASRPSTPEEDWRGGAGNLNEGKGYKKGNCHGRSMERSIFGKRAP